MQASQPESYCCPICRQELPCTWLQREGDSPCPRCGQPVWFVRKTVGDVVVLTFLPGLIGGAEALHRAAGVLEAAGSASLLIVNLAPMRFITSVFLSMLVHVRQEMIARGGALKLCGADGVAREVIEAACLDSVFEIYKDEAAAFRSCAAPRRDGFQQLLD